MDYKVRLTEAVRRDLLAKNEGFTTSTSYDSKNHDYVRDYLIKGGQVIIREVGKKSWEDSCYDKIWTADKDEVLRFLRNNLSILKI